MDAGRSMRAVKDSPVTRLFRNNFRTSGRETNKIGHPTARTSPRIRSIRFGRCSFDTRSGGATWPPSC
jgi:hypothetical protein